MAPPYTVKYDATCFAFDDSYIQPDQFVVSDGAGNTNLMRWTDSTVESTTHKITVSPVNLIVEETGVSSITLTPSSLAFLTGTSSAMLSHSGTNYFDSSPIHFLSDGKTSIITGTCLSFADTIVDRITTIDLNGIIITNQAIDQTFLSVRSELINASTSDYQNGLNMKGTNGGLSISPNGLSILATNGNEDISLTRQGGLYWTVYNESSYTSAFTTSISPINNAQNIIFNNFSLDTGEFISTPMSLETGVLTFRYPTTNITQSYFNTTGVTMCQPDTGNPAAILSKTSLIFYDVNTNNRSSYQLDYLDMWVDYAEISKQTVYLYSVDPQLNLYSLDSTQTTTIKPNSIQLFAPDGNVQMTVNASGELEVLNTIRANKFALQVGFAVITTTIDITGIQLEKTGFFGQSYVHHDEIKVYEPISGVFSIMDTGSVYSANTTTSNSARISATGQVLINESQSINSFMDSTGLSFVNGTQTARFESTNGKNFISSPVVYIKGSSEASIKSSSLFLSDTTSNITSQSELKASNLTFANTNSPNTANITYDSITLYHNNLQTGVIMNADGSVLVTTQPGGLNTDILITQIFGMSICFNYNLNNPISISSADGQSIQSGPFQPSSLLDVSGNAGVDGQYLISNGNSPVWATLPTAPEVNLSTVLATKNAGDAGNQSIYNLSSIAISNATSTTIIEPTSLTINDGVGEITKLTANGIYVESGSFKSSLVGNYLNFETHDQDPNFNQSITFNSASPVGVGRLEAGNFKPTSILDVSGNAGVDGQYLLSNGISPVWVTVPTAPALNLSTVLATPNAGDGNNLPISNLSSIAFTPSGGSQRALTFSSVASTSASPVTASYDVPTFSQGTDSTTARYFQNKYMEVVLDGVHYWMPLFI